MTPTTLSTIPRLIAQMLIDYGVDAEDIFSQAEINFAEVNNSQKRIPMEKMTRLWQLAVEATNNPELGLVAASLFQPAYLKGLGFAWMASESLEEGLRRFANNGKLLNSSIHIQLTEQKGELLIQYQAAPINEGMKPAHQCAIQLGIGFFLKMFSLAAGRNIVPVEVYFNYPIKESLSVYEDFFQCPVQDNSDIVGICFSKSSLNKLLPTHDPELVELNEMAVKKYLNEMDNGETTNKVIEIITELLPDGQLSEETIANKLHMSKRTLQRKLSSEGQHYSGLLNKVRLQLAKQYLTMTDASITQLTYQLGYSSPSTFARAFKKQTSLSPAEFRVQNKT